jgi:hypothetical protein
MICEMNNVKNPLRDIYIYIYKRNTYSSQLSEQLLLMLLHVSAANHSHLQGATNFEAIYSAYACCQIQVVNIYPY